MIHVHRIDSLDLPELAPYRTMRRQVEHRNEGIFVAESDKVVQRLLESPLRVTSVLFPERWLHNFESLLARRPEEIQVYIMEKSKLECLTGFSFYQGVLAVGHVPPAPTLEQLVARVAPGGFLVAVEGLTSAENLGSLVRSCVAFGAQGVLVDSTCCSPFLRRAVRGSMGTIFRIPALEKLNLLEIVHSLQKRGIACVATSPDTRAQALPNSKLEMPSCILFGSEGFGLSQEVLAACQASVSIPMAEGVDSLNVSSAAAVVLYELSRRFQIAAQPG